jgi:Arc/MetJ family transcription regulator
MTSKSRTTVRLDEDLMKKAQHRCIDEDLSFQQLVEKALREYLKKPLEQKGAKK